MVHGADPAALVRHHPLWPALAFPGLDPDSCGRLIALVLDPRSFVDPATFEHADRVRRFFQFDRPSLQRRAPRMDLARRAWFDSPFTGDDDPSQFLWRAWYAADSTPEATLGVTALAVEYVFLNWLERLVARPRPRCEAAAFQPELFFGRDGHGLRVAEAYLAHMERREAPGLA